MQRKLMTITAGVSALFVASTTFAKTAEEVLTSGSTPEEQGLAIAKEADIRDEGYGDSTVNLVMTLRNASGNESTRKLRTQTLEILDTALGDKSLNVFDEPRDVKGTGFLTFSKILDPDDQWMYLPALKRVKRISSKNKSGPFMGSEFALEDISSQEVNKYTYKYLRTEPCPTDTSLNCFVSERYPAYKYSGYTKQVGWIDTNEFRLHQTEFYDRKGDLLKTLKQLDYKQYLNQYWRADKFEMVNHQTGKSTSLSYDNYKFRVGLKDGDFTKANLKRQR